MVTINQIHMMPKKRSVWSNLSVPRYDQSLPTDLRGVFRTNYPRKVLFTKPVTFKTFELLRWKPKTIIGLRAFEEEDA